MDVVVTIDRARRRFAMPLLPHIVRAVVPRSSRGAYLLLRQARPVYVGRSDLCVRTRLSTHPLIGVATHFLWEPCRNRMAAFSIESIWFHRLQGRPGVLNFIHPASPAESGVACPFCNSHDTNALARALNATPAPGAARRGRAIDFRTWSSSTD